MNVPIIRLEVQAMKETICFALQQYAAQMDSSIQNAVEAYCSEGNIEAVVSKAVREAMDACVKEEVRNFFSYTGNGRKAIREAVIKRLDEIYGGDL